MMIITIIITASQHVPTFHFSVQTRIRHPPVGVGQSTIVEQHPPVGVGQKKNQGKASPFTPPEEDLWITPESCMRINHLHYQPQ